ncbi:MAG TPA: hypothetical protein PK498_11090, partial [Candidatus Kapabacteria bacterium]|nr:hypothetical protein [Candidatus Kapabacteria bacterium]
FAKSKTGQSGTNGVSVTLVDVEFAKNTSSTTPPTTGWTTTAPTLSEGEQLWTRTKTTYSSGSPTYTTPANITPKKGDVGTGVESVTEEYAISTSKTVQPTTGWSTTQPTWEQGKYIWSRVKVVYKNPSSIVYTGYSVSSEWEAVNDIQIGGRNLLLNSKGNFILLPQTTGQESDNWNYYRFYCDMEVGEQYTISANIGITAGDFTQVSIYPYPGDISGEVPIPASGRIKYTFTKTNATTDSVLIYAGVAGTTRGNGIIISKVKIEKGNKATDWTPAPEDVQAEIDAADAAAQAAQETANSANTAVGNLNDYVDGAFKDGVIEASEAKAIEKYINVVNTEKANLEATYNTLYANTYLEGTAKTNLLNAKITYFGAVDTLINSINAAIANGQTTIAEKQDVDTKYASYKTALASLQTAIESANEAIQTKLDELSTQKVDNLQIGGRNLLLNSKGQFVVSA